MLKFLLSLLDRHLIKKITISKSENRQSFTNNKKKLFDKKNKKNEIKKWFDNQSINNSVIDIENEFSTKLNLVENLFIIFININLIDISNGKEKAELTNLVEDPSVIFININLIDISNEKEKAELTNFIEDPFIIFININQIDISNEKEKAKSIDLDSKFIICKVN